MKEDEFHIVVHACIFNTKNEMLIQQRQATKKGWANLWDLSVGGSAIQNETSQMAIAREIKDELGITIDFKSKRPHFIINFDDGFDDFYCIEQDLLRNISIKQIFKFLSGCHLFVVKYFCIKRKRNDYETKLSNHYNFKRRRVMA